MIRMVSDMDTDSKLMIPVKISGQKDISCVGINVSRKSRDGYTYYINKSIWTISKDKVLNVSWTFKLDRRLRNGVIKTLSFYAENNAPDYAGNMNSMVKHYFVRRNNSEISPNSLISYFSSLGGDNKYYFGSIRAFLKKWHSLGYEGVDDDVIELVVGIRSKGNIKGRAVLSMDLDDGPFTDIEMSSILDLTREGYLDGSLSLEEYSLISVLAYCGRRIVQVCALKIKDVQRIQRENKNSYFIRFPRAKQRGVGWREEFSDFYTIEDLWLLLNSQADSVIKKINGMLGFPMPAEIHKEFPLFPNYRQLESISSLVEFKDKLKIDALHSKRSSSHAVLKKSFDKVMVLSERTGDKINIRSSRFRYTLGTNLAREGKGEYIIAESLDHSDTQNTGVYVKNIPDFVKKIDKAVALQLAPLAQAFQGVLVKSESEAKRGDDKRSRISNGKQNIGTCGSYGFCGALAPVACYTCSHFQPWLDGPHEAVLEELMQKRDQVGDETGDMKIASVNDRLILAVGEVVRRCNQVKAGQEGGSDE